jgi:transcription antitermination factor NusG
MKDFFATQINGYHHLKPLEDPFRWVVAIFSADGAVQAIIRANKSDLKTYYPIRFNAKSEPIPLFRNYVFVEFRKYITIDLCRETPNFIKVISAHDDEGMLRPVLVRRSAIDEHRAMILAGKFNERSINRQFYGRGSLVRVIEGTFIDKKVKLEEDVYPDWKGNHRVKVDIDGIKGTVELYKLSL